MIKERNSSISTSKPFLWRSKPISVQSVWMHSTANLAKKFSFVLWLELMGALFSHLIIGV